MTPRANILIRYASLSRRNRRLLRDAAVALGMASFAVAVLPFRRAIQIGSVTLSKGQGQVGIDEVRWAVEAAAARSPWRSMCIEQGIAMQRLLRRSGIDARLHYGARPGGSAGLQAHVWVTVDDAIVIGAADVPGFAELATFPQ
jgi:hypothetical protein